MDGLHIIHKTRCNFAWFFQPILPQLEKFHWLWEYENEPCDQRAMTETEQARYLEVLATLPPARTNCLYVPAGVLLPRFSHAVYNDWCDIYGFLHQPDIESFFQELDKAHARDHQGLNSALLEMLAVPSLAEPSQIMEEAEQELSRYLDAHVELCFFNVDGLFWDFYAKDTSLLQITKEYAQQLDHEIEVKEIVLGT